MMSRFLTETHHHSNFFKKEMPSYGRFFTFLPAKAKSRHEYHVRIPYGFYGTIPTASHSNLSLIEGKDGLTLILLYTSM